MLKDCIEIFSENLEKEDGYVLDNHIPKDGTYILVRKTDRGFEADPALTIQYNNKTKQVEGVANSSYCDVRFFDYYSNLIAMNKPIDTAKIIHSSHYLAFAVKKESLKENKLTPKIIDTYYQILQNPRLKYKTKKRKLLYEQVENDLGPVDQELAGEIKQWISHNIFNMDIDLEQKDYLKIFFLLEDQDTTKALYQKENMRYILPNLYNSNDYNIEIQGKIFGLPNDNMNMNSNKQYLANKKRGTVSVPVLLDSEAALLQAQFFDYLMGQVSKGKSNLYVDTEKRKIYCLENSEVPPTGMSGYFLRLRKDKNEAAIESFDTIVSYNPNLNPTFRYKAIFSIDDQDENCIINRRKDLEGLINEVFFNKCLTGNYFTKPEDLSIKKGVLRNNLLIARDRLFSWLYKNDGTDISAMLDKVSTRFIINSIQNGYEKKARKQLNLKWSLNDYFAQNDEMEETMYKTEDAMRKHICMNEPWQFDNDEEYYFAVGQMIEYFLSKSKASKKPLSFVNVFLNAKNDEKIKLDLIRLFKKYNYDILNYELKTKALMGNIMHHAPNFPVNQGMIIAGLTAKNVIFDKTLKTE